MKDYFVFAKAIRGKIIKLIDALSIDQLNQIPQGFRNNIAWHIGHIVVSTELLCYHRTAVDTAKVIPFEADYKNGSVPKEWISQDEIYFFKERLAASLREIEKDYVSGIFSAIQPYATLTFGVELTNIEAVFDCASHHDLLHFGHIQAMTKLLPLKA